MVNAPFEGLLAWLEHHGIARRAATADLHDRQFEAEVAIEETNLIEGAQGVRSGGGARTQSKGSVAISRAGGLCTCDMSERNEC